MRKLRATRPYRGNDGVSEIAAEAGDEIEVSDEKATQLLSDFPDGFEAASRPKKSDAEKRRDDESKAAKRPAGKRSTTSRTRRTTAK